MKKLLSSFLGVLFLFTMVLNAQNSEMDPDAAKFYNEGNKALKSGNFQGALNKYVEALKTSTDYRIFYQQGLTLKKLGKYDEAIAAFESSNKSNPKSYLGYNGLGGIYFQQGKYTEAIAAFEKFKELTDKNNLKARGDEYIAKSYTKLATAAKADFKNDQALDYLNNAISHFKFDAAYLLLAELYTDLGQYDKALSAADNALNNRKTITAGGPLYYKGKAFKGKNDVAKAKEAFTQGRKDSKYRQLCDYELDLLK